MMSVIFGHGMNEVSKILIPLKVSVIKIFEILLNVRTLREQSRPNKNSDIYSQNITICDMCTLRQQYITNSDSKSSIIEILLEKSETQRI